MKTPKDLFEDVLFRLQFKYGNEIFNTKQRPPGGLYIGKGSKFANPWRGSHDDLSRLRNIYRFTRYMSENSNHLSSDDKLNLRTKKLVCYCNDGSNAHDKSKFCHGMILKAIANDDFNWTLIKEISND